MAIRAGAQITAIVTVGRRNTGTRLNGIPVAVQKFDPAVGDYVDEATGITGNNGEARIRFRVPDQPGEYRFRSRSDPTPQYRADTSPAEKVEIV